MNNITPEMARQELARRGINLHEKMESPSQPSSLGSNILNKLAIPAEYINKAVEGARLPSLAGGALQGLADTGISLANIPLQGIGAPTIPHPDLQKYLPTDPASRAAFLGGEIAGSLPIAGGLYKKAGELLPGITGKAKAIADILKGSAVGAATEEQGPYGREGGAVLGGAIPAISSFIPKKIANAIVQSKDEAQELYRKAYKSLFKKADEQGIKNIKLPKVDTETIFEGALPKYKESLKDLLANPSLENAHWAQSDLGALTRHMENLSKQNPLTSSQIKVLQKAKEAQKKILGSMFQASSKNPELSAEYEKLSTGYNKDVVPFKSIPEIDEYADKKLKAGNLIKSLGSNDAFMLEMGHKFPQLQILTHPISKVLGYGTLGAAGLGTIGKIGTDIYRGS